MNNELTLADTDLTDFDLTEEVPEEFVLNGVAYTASATDLSEDSAIDITHGNGYLSTWDPSAFSGDAPPFAYILEELIDEGEFVPTTEEKTLIATALVSLGQIDYEQAQHDLEGALADIQKAQAWLNEAALGGDLHEQLESLYSS